VVKSAADPESLAGPVRALLRDIDPLLPVYDFRSFDDVAERAKATARFTMWLGAASAGVALLMACVGLYGVLSYSVASRTHELGLRMALGAEPATMVTLVVRQGMAVAGTGLAIGVVAAWLASRYVEALLFGVTAGDPVSYLIAVPALTVTAVAACGWPACRASRVDPVVALRAEAPARGPVAWATSRARTNPPDDRLPPGPVRSRTLSSS
jgi:predicted lysophospholipase L1 biosynthesis ABC-type transport system permease subunit